ncbi:regulator of G-protein signaling 5 [Latimeria chalumnae]|uniref:Regulator of G protein signaling 16 n=1 Tax=Latimeria chalumnae TaxID=7897 RepID=H3ACV3_LATCH|nr:PREDICTED: regulator of G-protein signaling 5-like [Latimeria chalumnae]|eukprot:XP_006008316.1 PREDICTED: regulator of G-protein signaling 5-like [Latimeria chalumnae]
MCRGLASLPTTCLERAKEFKTRLGILLQKSDTQNESLVSNKTEKANKLSICPDEVSCWKESLDKLLSSKQGLATFRIFLKSEFSEENLDFWMACEDYKKIKSPAKLASKAKKIYEEFIQTDATREINIDYETRDITKKNILEATPSCFDEAQNKIYILMKKDSYLRFLKSAVYQGMVKKTACNSSSQQNHGKRSQT